MVVHYPPNMTFPLQMLNRYTSKAAVDFETFDEDGLADEAEGGDFLHDTVEHGLVDMDRVVRLVLDLSLRPLLLLGGFAS